MSKLSASDVLSKYFDDEGEPSPDELSEDDESSEIDGFSETSCSSSSEYQSDSFNDLDSKNDNDKVDSVAQKNAIPQSAQNIQPRLSLKRNSRGIISTSVNANCKNAKAAKKPKISKKITLEDETVDTYVSRTGFIWNKAVPNNNFDDSQDFSIESALKESVANCQTLKDYFNYFIDEPMLDLIVKATNKKIQSNKARKYL
jgi:hypothetical protein